MKQLNTLYKEVSPKYQNIAEKRDELRARINELEVQYKFAEEQLNTKEMTMIQAELSTTRELHKKLDDKCKAELTTNSSNLRERVFQAIEEDWKEVQEKDTFSKQAEEHLNKAIEALKNLAEYGASEGSKLNKAVGEFNGLLTGEDWSFVNGIANYKGFNNALLNDLETVKHKFFN